MTKLVKIIGIILLLNIIVPLVGLSNSNASEHNSILKGEYVFSGTVYCARGPEAGGPEAEDAFNPDDLSRNADGFVFTGYVQGMLNFNGDGTGSITFTALSIKPLSTQAGQYPVGGAFSPSTATLSYNVYEDKTFTITFHENKILDGWIGQGNQLLLLNDNQPNIEIRTNQNGVVTGEAICGRNWTAMRKKLTE
jgi:hypothetical protein